MSLHHPPQLAAPYSAGPATLDPDAHMPVLDGVRGLAVLMVLIFHFIGTAQPTNSFERLLVGAAGYGAYGVELFFVLSGFLITGILYCTHNAPHYFRDFYMRRVLRIFPVYYGVLVIIFFVAPLIPALAGPTLQSLLDKQAWAWLYAVNIHIAREGEWSFSYLQHFWSLAIEEHFYLFWPLVVFALAHRPRALIAGCLGTAAFAILARLAGTLLGLSWWTTDVLTPFRLDGLALGACMAIVIRQPGGLLRLMASLPRVAAAGCLLLMASYAWTRLASRQGLEIILTLRAALVQILLACLLLWTLTVARNSRTSRFFCSRTMMQLGTYSYGLYVYHHFFSYFFSSHRTEFALAQLIGSHAAAIFLQAAFGIAASLLVAYVSYHFFESRFLALKHYFEAPRSPQSARRDTHLHLDHGAVRSRSET